MADSAPAPAPGGAPAGGPALLLQQQQQHQQADAPGAAPGLYSITSHFDGRCNVLLTGASGYIGSLVVEKLLRDTNVGHVYLLLRSRRGVAPAERVAKLLSGPLFHLLAPGDAARVSAVAGDISEEGLGLSPEDEAMLLDKIDTVIHSAAGARAGPRMRAWGPCQRAWGCRGAACARVALYGAAWGCRRQLAGTLRPRLPAASPPP